MAPLLFAYPTYFAHRGHADRPENTAAAMLYAKEKGASWVEFDAQLTADGQLVIFHDDKLDRTSTGTGLLAKHTLAELQQLDVSSWHPSSLNSRSVSEKIMTLTECFSLLEQEQLHANLEVKVNGIDDQQYENILIGINEALAASKYQQHLLISSTEQNLLTKLARDLPKIPLALILDTWQEEAIQFAKTTCQALHINHKLIDKKSSLILGKLGIKIGAYTVNYPDRARQLFELGTDGIFTDYIERMPSLASRAP